ncbi:MAG: menaquinone biosynthesis protein [Thermodesulfovibrionales bacterium]|nr:menaquinone biosynthesis protein [Thermodesulfovibrionales bacterium]
MMLKIGRIPYANLFPIFYNLNHIHQIQDYQYVDGVPTHLNNLLKEGSIDLSPSSSIEYIKNKDIYDYIDGHSVSSFGQIGSIFLFSNEPIQNLNEKIIKVTSHSATSICLLEIITNEFYNVFPKLVSDDKPYYDKDHPFLLIGDEALIHFKTDKTHNYIYDLGEIWYDFTGLPFVFALWIVRRKNLIDDKKRNLFNSFVMHLNTAKNKAYENISEIAQYYDLKGILTRDEIVNYWKKIDYNLTDRHKEGLKLFEELYFKVRGD